jgi:hypothetical protein
MQGELVTDEDEWAALLAERKTPAGGRGVPINLIRRPVQLPPMVSIQRGEDCDVNPPQDGS